MSHAVSKPAKQTRNLWGVAMVLPGGLHLRKVWEESRYPGQPPSYLLFCTRQQARDWIAEYEARRKSELIKNRAVRVTETLAVTEGRR